MIEKVGDACISLFVVTVLGVAATPAMAGPNCDTKPDHPSCQGDGGAGEPPPVESDPAYAYVFAGSVFLVNEDGTAPTLLLEGQPRKGRNKPGVAYDGPEWDPSGAKLAYSRNGLLEVILLDGGSTPMPPDSGIAAGSVLSWSSSGEQIAFSAQTGPSRDDVFAVNVGPANNGGPAKNVTETLQGAPGFWGPVYFQPSWSPDGARLAFRHWSFSESSPEEIFDILICEPFKNYVEATCDASNTTVWREFDESSYFVAPVWHPSDDLIGYIPQGVEMLIEGVDNNTCIQLYNSNPDRVADGTGPGLRAGCIAKDVGNFFFGGDFDWSCDGQALVVTGNFDDGNFDTTGEWGIHRIENVLDDQDTDLRDNIASLATVGDYTEVPQSPASRCTPN